MSQTFDPAAEKGAKAKESVVLPGMVNGDELEDDLDDDVLPADHLQILHIHAAPSEGGAAAPPPSPSRAPLERRGALRGPDLEADARGARLGALGLPLRNDPMIIGSRQVGEKADEHTAPAEGEAGTVVAGTPTTLAEVAEMSAQDIDQYPGATGTAMPTGPQARPILMRAFGENWFFAKDVLISKKWPASIRSEAPLKLNPDLAIKLMWKLLALRIYEYDGILDGLRKRYKAKDTNKALKDPEILEWGSAGSVTLTSDIDVNLGGKYNMEAVADFNSEFHKRGWGVEAGTGLDVNVYCKDNMHGFDFESMAAQPEELQGAATTAVMTVATEANMPKNIAEEEDDSKNQEIAAMVKLMRFLCHAEDWKDNADWAKYKRSQRCDDGTPRADRPIEQYKKIAMTQVRYDAWRHQLDAMKEKLVDEGSAAVDALAGIAADNDTKAEQALDMQASNRLYEAKIEKIKELRAYLVVLKTKPGDNIALIKQVAVELRQAILEAGMFANEAMITAGASNFVVFGTQLGVKDKVIGKASTKLGGGITDISIKLTEAQFYHAFTEQLADTIKEFHHYADLPSGLFKGGKYLMRMTLAADQLDGVNPAAIPDYELLRGLGDMAMTAKNMSGTVDSINSLMWAAITVRYPDLPNKEAVGDFLDHVLDFGTAVTAAYQAAKAAVVVPPKPTNQQDPNFVRDNERYKEALAQKRGTKLKIAEVKGANLSQAIEYITDGDVRVPT